MENRSLVKINKKENVLFRYIDNYQLSDLAYRKPMLLTFKILRETEKSYFIDYIGEVRVPKKGKNIFAWDTEEKALFNYFKRKEKQLKILESKLRDTKENLNWSEMQLEFKKRFKEENPTTTILEKLKEVLW